MVKLLVHEPSSVACVLTIPECVPNWIFTISNLPNPLPRMLISVPTVPDNGEV